MKKKLSNSQIEVMQIVEQNLVACMAGTWGLTEKRHGFGDAAQRTLQAMVTSGLLQHTYIHNKERNLHYSGYTLTPVGLQWISDNCAPVDLTAEVPALADALQQLETDAVATLATLQQVGEKLEAPKFSEGDYVIVNVLRPDRQEVQRVTRVDADEFGITYWISNFWCAWEESELADASLVYDQSQLPAPEFAVGDSVVITAEYDSTCGEQRRITEIKWAYGRYFYYTGRMKNVNGLGISMRMPECFFGYELKSATPKFQLSEPVIIDDNCLTPEVQANTVYEIARIEWQFNEWVYWLEGVVKTFWFDYELKTVIDHYRDDRNWLEREVSVR